MGLLTGILTSPAKGILFALEQIRKQADQELYDETLWQQKLLDLQLRYDLDEIGQEEFETQENAILSQLDLIRSLQEAETETEEQENDDS